MNPVFNIPQLKREEIAFELAKIKSPLTILFKQIYPKSLYGVKEKLLPILDKILSTDEVELEDYEMFAIVYYIFRVIPTYSGRIQITQKMFDGWKEYINSKYGAEFDVEFDLGISGGKRCR